IPSRLAHRARPIRQCRDDATSARLLPPSPPAQGLGCHQRRPATMKTEPWRSPTSIRTTSAWWRTFLSYTFPSRSPPPPHPAVPGRRDFVEAAPTLPTDPRLRLPPASPRRYDGEEMAVLHLHPKHQRLVAHSGCLQLHPTAATARRWTVSHLHPQRQRLAAHPDDHQD